MVKGTNFYLTEFSIKANKLLKGIGGDSLTKNKWEKIMGASQNVA